jgi:2-polyprenyl-3-methyl-5-hydroxy-6-metoxy-1,4-benzoquinol methylase
MVYTGEPPPWDIGRPQRVFVDVADRVAGSVLDAGCGTGENALFFAARGLEVMGIDFLPNPVEQASRKASARGLRAKFLVMDALTLSQWNERFDVVLDSGLFHVFDDDDRARYVAGLATIVKPGGRLFLLCFSDAQPGTEGPRRVSKAELTSTFARDWSIESLEPTTFEVRPELRAKFGDVEPKAWFLVARRS